MSKAATLDEAFALPRVAIVGPPRTGKTTLARARGLPEKLVIHTDDLISRFEWSELSAHLVRMCATQKYFIVEGVRVAHALRKGLMVDAVVWLGRPWVRQTPAQASMGKAVETVFSEFARQNCGRIPIVRAP